MSKKQEVENVKRFNSWAEQNPCTILLSYPRSGRGWILSLMEQITNKPTLRIFDSPEEEYDKYLFFYWHGYWYSEYLSQKALDNIQFTVIMRDLRDCAISDAYHRVTHGNHKTMSVDVVDEAIDDLVSKQVGLKARFDYFRQSDPILYYERMCLSPVAELQKLIDCLDTEISTPVDWVVHDLDSEKIIQINFDGSASEIIDRSIKYKTGEERYQARCLKWKKDVYFRPEHNSHIYECYRDLMLQSGYTEDGHNLERLSIGLESMGTWPIGTALLNFIRAAIPDPEGMRKPSLLELGSGAGTGVLAKTYTMTSIEHYSKWIGIYDSNYIHAPLVDGWYDTEKIKDALSGNAIKFAGILIDGPAGSESRARFIDHTDLFDLSSWVIFDDIHRNLEYEAYMTLANRLKRTHAEFKDIHGKAFGVIEPSDGPYTSLEVLSKKLQLTYYLPGEQQ